MRIRPWWKPTLTLCLTSSLSSNHHRQYQKLVHRLHIKISALVTCLPILWYVHHLLPNHDQHTRLLYLLFTTHRLFHHWKTKYLLERRVTGVYLLTVTQILTIFDTVFFFIIIIVAILLRHHFFLTWSIAVIIYFIFMIYLSFSRQDSSGSLCLLGVGTVPVGYSTPTTKTDTYMKLSLLVYKSPKKGLRSEN